MHKITESCTECFSICPNITSKFCTITIFKCFVKHKNHLYKTCRYVHDLLLYISCLHKTKYGFQLSTALHKNCLVRNCSSFEDLSVCKTSCSCWLVRVLQSLQKSEHLPYLNSWSYEIQKHDVKVTFNGMTSLSNSIKMYWLIQKLLGGYKQAEWISHKPHFPF
jgi:hypothetical protein